MVRGLTLGKFAPFHRGHQTLIEHALAEVDHLTCIVYAAPETTTIPLQIRAGWIMALYPSVHVIEAWDGPAEVSDRPEVQRAHEQYINGLLRGVRIAKFFSGESYGAHMAHYLKAEDCRLDRTGVPVSGTTIRDRPHEYRAYLDPLVYRDLVVHVALVGAPSTGKTTLARALAEELGGECVEEYGREYWHNHQIKRRLTMKQLEEIAVEHRRREIDAQLRANRYLFVDTNAVTTYMFARQYHGAASDTLTTTAESCHSRVDLWLLCDDDIEYADTWDRSGQVNRQRFQRWIEDDLKARRIPYLRVSGELSDRITYVKKLLSHVEKYSNPIESVLEATKWK